VKLYVDSNVRGKSIAAKLLSYGEKKIHNQGTGPIVDAVLFCTAGNVRAQRFYNREGWTLTKTFSDRLWLPESASGEFIVDTHRYSKQLGVESGRGQDSTLRKTCRW